MNKILLTCLEKDQSKRFQSCQQMKRALESGEIVVDVPFEEEEKEKIKDERLKIKKEKGKKIKDKRGAVGKWAGVAAVILVLVLIGLGLKEGWFGAHKQPGVVTMDDMKDESWQQLTDLEKQRIETLLKEADHLFINDRLVEPPDNNAYALYQKVLKIHPGNKYALAQLALIKKDFLKRGELEYGKGNYAGALNIAQAGLGYFKGDAALRALQQKSQLRIMERQARALAKQKQYIEPAGQNAYALCQKILKIDSENAVAQEILKEIAAWFAQRGQQAEKDKDWATAVSLYSQALKYFKDDTAFQQRLAQTRQALQQQKAFRTKIDGLLSRAGQQAKNGQYEAAWQTYNRVLQLSPGEQRAQSGKQAVIDKMLFMAKKQMEKGRYGEAEKTYGAVLKLLPGESRARQGMQKAQAERQKWLNWIDWVWVEGGTFEMGCTSEQSNCDDDEKPVHWVTVDGFYMSKYEVTHAQYIAFLNAANVNPDGSKNAKEYIDMDDGDCAIGYRNGRFYFKGSARAEDINCPVIEVTWYGAVAYCEWLSQKTGTTIRLPTEAEWEYAARGGRKSRGYKYAGSNDVDAVAWYDGNSGGKTHPVGQKQPNELGLYDMSGNVWEWCLDWYDSDYYSGSPRNNPRGPSGGAYRVLRGGSWSLYARYVRVANRDGSTPPDCSYVLGFRLLRTK